MSIKSRCLSGLILIGLVFVHGCTGPATAIENQETINGIAISSGEKALLEQMTPLVQRALEDTLGQSKGRSLINGEGITVSFDEIQAAIASVNEIMLQNIGEDYERFILKGDMSLDTSNTQNGEKVFGLTESAIGARSLQQGADMKLLVNGSPYFIIANAKYVRYPWVCWTWATTTTLNLAGDPILGAYVASYLHDSNTSLTQEVRKAVDSNNNGIIDREEMVISTAVATGNGKYGWWFPAVDDVWSEHYLVNTVTISGVRLETWGIWENGGWRSGRLYWRM